MSDKEKKCSICKRKGRNFPKDRTTKDGLYPQCKDCHRAIQQTSILFKLLTCTRWNGKERSDASRRPLLVPNHQMKLMGGTVHLLLGRFPNRERSSARHGEGDWELMVFDDHVVNTYEYTVVDSSVHLQTIVR